MLRQRLFQGEVPLQVPQRIRIRRLPLRAQQGFLLLVLRQRLFQGEVPLQVPQRIRIQLLPQEPQRIRIPFHRPEVLLLAMLVHPQGHLPEFLLQYIHSLIHHQELRHIRTRCHHLMGVPQLHARLLQHIRIHMTGCFLLQELLHIHTQSLLQAVVQHIRTQLLLSPQVQELLPRVFFEFRQPLT